MVNQVDDGVADLAQVVRGDVGRHSHRDARCPVDQHIGETGGQDRRLGKGIVKIGREIHRVLVNVGQEFIGHRGQPRLGVAHRRRRVAVNAAEVALPGNQRVAHRKVLRQSHQSVVYRSFAVGMKLAQHFPGDPGALAKLRAGADAHIVHGVQDAPLHRLQPVAHVGKRPRHYNAHGISQIGSPHFVLNADRLLSGRSAGRNRGGSYHKVTLL